MSLNVWSYIKSPSSSRWDIIKSDFSFTDFYCMNTNLSVLKHHLNCVTYWKIYTFTIQQQFNNSCHCWIIWQGYSMLQGYSVVSQCRMALLVFINLKDENGWIIWQEMLQWLAIHFHYLLVTAIVYLMLRITYPEIVSCSLLEIVHYLLYYYTHQWVG